MKDSAVVGPQIELLEPVEVLRPGWFKVMKYCNKPGCKKCPHGPYWQRSKYVKESRSAKSLYGGRV